MPGLCKRQGLCCWSAAMISVLLSNRLEIQATDSSYKLITDSKSKESILYTRMGEGAGSKFIKLGWRDGSVGNSPCYAKMKDLSLNPQMSHKNKIKTHIGMANPVIPALRSRQADSLVLAGSVRPCLV